MIFIKLYLAKVVFYRPRTLTVGLQRGLVWHYSRDELNLPRDLGRSLLKPVCSTVGTDLSRWLLVCLLAALDTV